jgi:hypothetical protein
MLPLQKGDMVVSLPELQVIAGFVRDPAAVLSWARIEDNLKRLMDEGDKGNPSIPVGRPGT